MTIKRMHLGTGRLSRAAQLGICLVTAGFTLAASAVVIAPEGANPRHVAPGEVLIGELNCAACHTLTPQLTAHINSRTAPILDGIGSRVTPGFIRSFIESPGRIKAGTTMPDMLASLEPARRREVVEALTHYLVSLAGAPPVEVRGDEGEVQRGKVLYHQIGCVACHAPRSSVASVIGNSGADAPAPAELAESGGNSVPLGDLARKYSVGQLTEFLLNPLKYRPSGRMPEMKLDRGEARALAMYLLREQIAGARGGSPTWVEGVDYAYYEGEVRDDASNLESLNVVKKGVSSGFDLSVRSRNDNIGILFTGSISIPADGSYKFYTTSDDGSRLLIDGQLVVNNDGVHPAQTKSGEIGLTAGHHAIKVTYFNGGGELELKVEIEGPGLSRRVVAGELLSHSDVPMHPIDWESLTPDPAKVQSGRGYFSSYGCASCHAVDGVKSGPSVGAHPLSLVDADNPDGCLGNAKAEGAARYLLSSAEKEAMQRALKDKNDLMAELAPADKVEREMVAFGCYACHSRSGVGGPANGRADYFVVVGGVDLGDEGRIPPHLTRVGYKLRTEWIGEVLWKKAAVRPYMATRMPQFGRMNMARLPEEFATVDQTANGGTLGNVNDLVAKKAGRKLVGTEGLSCVSCHVFADHPSLGIPAIDLKWMSQRLNPAWFRDYLLDPQSLRPGTRMPSFWPEGKSVKADILSGDTRAQVGAIWAYLADGAQAKLPEGMTAASMPLVADKEAIIYRNFIAGAGSRAIAVGYPEKADLAFDANNMALAMVWHGAFIDAARHRNGRGEGFEGPLGEDVVQLGAFPPFADLQDVNQLWPRESGKKAGYQMRGYVLDEMRRPKFLYSYKEMKIEDYPQAVRVNDDPVLRREIRIEATGSSSGLYFLAAKAGQIARRDDGSFLVDGKLTIKLQSGGTPPAVRKVEGGYELITPVQFLGSQAIIKEEFSW